MSDAPNDNTKRDLPIGVFDSGVGGLTVLAAIHKALPKENLLYLGDTARLPYGTKSSETIKRYALQTSAMLVERKVKMLVIACNTATAAALPVLKETFPDIPVIGVIAPGAQAACATTKNERILVIGTESTIKNEAYQKAIKLVNPNAKVTGVACTLFVPLAEEGWLGRGTDGKAKEEGAIARSVAKRYLSEAVKGDASGAPDCIVLGCTHFPPLALAIQEVAGSSITLVDSAQTTAQAVKAALEELSIAREGSLGNWHFLTTDDPERFMRVGSLFLGATIEKDCLELVTL